MAGAAVAESRPFRAERDPIFFAPRPLAHLLAETGRLPHIAPKAAEIRAIHQVRTPDAIQLATAFLGGATHFLTNDRALRKYTEIQILVVADLA